MSISLEFSLILYEFLTFSIMKISLNLSNCLRILLDAMPWSGILLFFLNSMTSCSTSTELIGCFAFNITYNMSTMISLESPGCNKPTLKHNFLTRFLSEIFSGFSYFLRFISASGLSIAMIFLFNKIPHDKI